MTVVKRLSCPARKIGLFGCVSVSMCACMCVRVQKKKEGKRKREAQHAKSEPKQQKEARDKSDAMSNNEVRFHYVHLFITCLT